MAADREVRLGFIGLGDMGRGMATNLAKAGFPLKVYDLIPSAIQTAVDAGATAATSLGDVVEYADHLHICVIYDEQVTGIVSGPGGILELGRPGQIIVIHSTVSPLTVQECAKLAADKGIAVLDCPVSGGHIGSREGTLTLMLGGDTEVIEACRPFLEKVGTKFFHVGGVGAGQAMKLANNVMAHCNRLIYLEALQLAEAFGITEQIVDEIVTVSSGMSYSQKNHAGQDRHIKTHTLASSPELPFRFAKDLRYATQISLDKLLYMPMTVVGSQVAPEVYAKRWQRMLDEGREF